MPTFAAIKQVTHSHVGEYVLELDAFAYLPVRIARNLGAGVASSIWSALIGIAVVPFYIRYLGIEAYGLIGFMVTTQALFQILDMGMAPTINREIARCSATGEWSQLRDLLHTLALIYWVVAGGICVLMLALAPSISEHWLRAGSIQHSTLMHAVMLMGVVIASRWPVGLYQAALNGLQRIATASAITIAMVSLASLGSVFVLAFVSPTIEALFLWQAAAGLTYALVSRGVAWRNVRHAGNARINWRALGSVWRFSASMMALTFSGLVFSQLDKVLLSKLLNLEAFGQYMLAGVVASALSLLITPFYNALYPRFASYVVRDQTSQLLQLYRVGGRLLATLLFPIAMIIAVAGKDVILLWTGNQHLADAAAPLAGLLAIGTAVHGTMYIPHALLLAQGKTFIPLTTNLVLLVIMVPITVWLAFAYGALGGAIAWLLLHALYVILATCLMERYVGNSTGVPWLVREVGLPLLICCIVGLITACIVRSINLSALGNILIAGFMAALSIALTFAMSPSMRIGVMTSVSAELRR
jgi:O-antigen/teichoic acid export membrane protein